MGKKAARDRRVVTVDFTGVPKRRPKGLRGPSPGSRSFKGDVIRWATECAYKIKRQLQEQGKRRVNHEAVRLAVEHMRSIGWKVSRSTIYDNLRNGRCKPR